MTTVAELLDRAAILLYDTGNNDYPALELLDYLNEGLQRMLALRPDQFTVTQVVTHVAGTKQTLPAGGVRFIRVARAVNLDGTPGRAASQFDWRAMDAVQPGWHFAPAASVRQYAGSAYPNMYWVYPPSDGSKAEIEFVKEPAPLMLSDTLPVPPMFDQPLLDYVLARAYSKDTEYAGQDDRAAAHMSMFERGLNGAGAGSA